MWRKVICFLFHHRWGSEVTKQKARVVYTECHCERCGEVRYGLLRWVED